MRRYIHNELQKYPEIILLHNDLWPFKSKQVIDLGGAENMIWGYALGLLSVDKKPIIYNVSFFGIGRLEQLRKFFGYNKNSCFIISAGASGYDLYGWEHAFKNNEDIELFKNLNFKIIDLSKLTFGTPEDTTVCKVNFKSALNEYLNEGGNFYVRLPKEIQRRI